VIAELRKHVPGSGSDRYLAPEMATVVLLAKSGALIRAAKAVTPLQ
jgi:histidine ammonia-lyase